jgi:hypothetical protein
MAIYEVAFDQHTCACQGPALFDLNYKFVWEFLPPPPQKIIVAPIEVYCICTCVCFISDKSLAMPFEDCNRDSTFTSDKIDTWQDYFLKAKEHLVKQCKLLNYTLSS